MEFLLELERLASDTDIDKSFGHADGRTTTFDKLFGDFGDAHVLLLRVVCGVLFAIGGWQLASGLRRANDVTAWQGLGMIAVGLALEVVLKVRQLPRTDAEPHTLRNR